jgi:hypothetical protein
MGGCGSGTRGDFFWKYQTTTTPPFPPFLTIGPITQHSGTRYIDRNGCSEVSP